MTSLRVSYQIGSDKVQAYRKILLSWRAKIETGGAVYSDAPIKVQKDAVDKLISNTPSGHEAPQQKVTEKGCDIRVVCSLLKVLGEEINGASRANLHASHDSELRVMISISNIIKQAMSGAVSSDIEKPVI